MWPNSQKIAAHPSKFLIMPSVPKTSLVTLAIGKKIILICTIHGLFCKCTFYLPGAVKLILSLHFLELLMV